MKLNRRQLRRLIESVLYEEEKTGWQSEGAGILVNVIKTIGNVKPKDKTNSGKELTTASNYLEGHPRFAADHPSTGEIRVYDRRDFDHEAKGPVLENPMSKEAGEEITELAGSSTTVNAYRINCLAG